MMVMGIYSGSHIKSKKIEPLRNVEVVYNRHMLNQMTRQAINYINDHIAEADDKFIFGGDK